MAIKLQERSITSAPATASDLRPTVLVFDSGVGGLSVYDEVRQLLPDLHYLYAFDNEGFPYGEKSEDFIVDRVVAVVHAITQRFPLALVIIACNSASTVSLPALRERFEFPVVGVVPAIKPAARLTRNGVVGLLATRGTVKRPYTHELVAQFARECKIEMLGSAELVELAEAKLHGEEVELSDVRRAVQPWLRMKEPPDTVVLGCTHFPLLRDELQMVLPEGTRLVDSGAAIARRTVWLLEHEAPHAVSSGQNMAFCTRMDDEVMQLSPVLQRYGFPLLEKLAI
ncbi:MULTISPECIES: glutamate racemase [Pantoea]|uniref:Glutamate racemase n=2 Tax=Pantoea TaxID=53335 RepID=A0A0U3UX24_9GAMM|nr:MULTISPECIES: glutamate racemase [Pantoea]ALV94234.1 glutamate racemase [Pantoea vagans]KHJ65491.1 glutamate racemase [Pantoea rodasii]